MLERFDAIVVTSPHCEPHLYRSWASTSIDVDAPGVTSANLATLGHTRCPRSIYPLDEVGSYVPEPRVLTRER